MYDEFFTAPVLKRFIPLLGVCDVGIMLKAGTVSKRDGLISSCSANSKLVCFGAAAWPKERLSQGLKSNQYYRNKCV